MKLAISTWSFQQRLASGAMTQMDCISKAKELGADAIEFVDVLPPAGVSREDYARQLGEACKEQGLGVSNYTIGADFLANDVQDEVDRIAKELELALLLGATSIRHDVTGGIPGPARATTGFEQVADRLAAACRAVTERAEAKGVATMVENHGFFFQDVDRVESLVTRVGHPNFGLLFDMGNFLCGDVEPSAALGRLAPFVRYVHAKDFIVKEGAAPDPGRGFFRSRGGRYLRGTIIGHGDVPVAACLGILKEAGYAGGLGIEFEGMEDCLEGIAIGLENLRRYLA